MSGSERKTLSRFASEEMARIVVRLIELADTTANFQAFPAGAEGLDEETGRLLLAGRGFEVSRLPPPDHWPTMWLARGAFPFNLEKAATTELYARLDPFLREMVAYAYAATVNFATVTPEWVRENPHLLPVMMHALGIFSKHELVQRMGTVSDSRISSSSSEQIVHEFARLGPDGILDEPSVRERIRATSEGIVRGLVGHLLEEFVATAVRAAGVPVMRERDYKALSGVVYDFRADFVIPDPAHPSAFIEVRKSSQRHASLYAKDKMFSAINWKGKHRDAIGVLVVDGPWTAASLDVLARVFDYVVPVGRVAEVARRIREYLDGDRSALRWMITFKVEPVEHAP